MMNDTSSGIGFHGRHFDALIADGDPPGFIEVHAENYMGAGGRTHAQLARLRESLPLSLHGVGLSLGGATPPEAGHLARLVALQKRYQPAWVSEHLAWSTHDGRFFNDLLPVTYDEATLQRVVEHVDHVQSSLGQQLLMENPSRYFDLPGSDIDEPEFLAALVARTGCGLLLDINNVHVSCTNTGRDPAAYLRALPLPAVREIHLAGHAHDVDASGRPVLIDDHGAPVAVAVWTLYRAVLAATGPIATLIEWDTDVPAYDVLRAEARPARACMPGANDPAREWAA